MGVLKNKCVEIKKCAIIRVKKIEWFKKELKDGESKIRSRFYMIMQYEKNPLTGGGFIFNRETVIIKGIAERQKESASIGRI